MSDKSDKSMLPATNDERDRCHDFSKHSHARLGLGHAGGHMKTTACLDFQAGFAQAKDAVFSSFDAQEISLLCEAMRLPFLHVHSQAQDVHQHLMRPDLGRLLSVADEARLQQLAQENDDYQHQDILLVISGGLSPLAIQHQIPIFLPLFVERLRENKYSLAPVLINPRGRVALGDQLNAIFKATVVVNLIGERPGLSTPDSMGIYITQHARPGCTDHIRHCISNIHQQGLAHADAVTKCCELLEQFISGKLNHK